MKITILGETVAMEGNRLIRKEVKVYTVWYPHGNYNVQEKVYHNPKNVIDKMLNKTFEGIELSTHVEVNLNKVL